MKSFVPCLTSFRQTVVSRLLSLCTNVVSIGDSGLHSLFGGGTVADKCVLRWNKFLGRSCVCDARTLAWCHVRGSPAAGAEEHVRGGRCVCVCV